MTNKFATVGGKEITFLILSMFTKIKTNFFKKMNTKNIKLFKLNSRDCKVSRSNEHPAFKIP